MAEREEILVWDVLVRLFHWLLVLGVFLLFITGETVMAVHVVVGFTVLGLLVFRTVWGFIGPEHAQFCHFVRTPQQTWAYLRSIAAGHSSRYLGHNPAGGVMVVMLLLTVFATVFLGVVAYGVGKWSGPMAGLAFTWGLAGTKIVMKGHEFFASLLLCLVVLHLLGVVFTILQHRENLIKSMFTGRKMQSEALMRQIVIIVLVVSGLIPGSGHAATVDALLAGYRLEGAEEFSAKRGEVLLNQVVTDKETQEDRRCTTCHAPDPKKPGKHQKTGKMIEPLAPVANAERLQDAAKVEKWFQRNCTWTLGRVCTPQEKGDFLTYLQSF